VDLAQVRRVSDGLVRDRYMVPWSLTHALGSAFNAGYPSYVLAFDTTWEAPPPCTDPTTGAACPCDSNMRCIQPPGSGGSKPFLCTEITNGQSCTCGSTPTCRPPQSPQPQPLCYDSQTNQSCKCKSSPTCISSVPRAPMSCFDKVAKAPCNCADKATNPNCQTIN